MVEKCSIFFSNNLTPKRACRHYCKTDGLDLSHIKIFMHFIWHCLFLNCSVEEAVWVGRGVASL